MSDAFLAADLLAEAIHDGLLGDRPLDNAVADYQHQRDVLTANGFDLTLSTARLAPLSARLEAFYREAADQPDLVRQIFGVLGGSIPAAHVYPMDGQAVARSNSTKGPGVSPVSCKTRVTG